MALCPGIVSVTIEFADGLKDHDLIFRQSPYCILSVGTQTYRTQTASRGGTNPVWNETFQFNICNENDLMIEIKDSELGRDPNLGSASVNLSNVRQYGQDRQQVPVYSTRTQAQHGFVSVALQWQSQGWQQPMYGGTPQSMNGGMQQPMYGGGMQQPMYGGGMQQPMYSGGMQQQMYGGGGGMMAPMGGGMVAPMGGNFQPYHHHHHHHGGEQVVFIERPW